MLKTKAGKTENSLPYSKNKYLKMENPPNMTQKPNAQKEALARAVRATLQPPGPAKRHCGVAAICKRNRPNMITGQYSWTLAAPLWRSCYSGILASSHAHALSEALPSLELHQKGEKNKNQQREKESRQLQPGPP